MAISKSLCPWSRSTQDDRRSVWLTKEIYIIPLNIHMRPSGMLKTVDWKFSWLTSVKHQPATPNHKQLEFRWQCRRDQTPIFLLTSFLSSEPWNILPGSIFFRTFLNIILGEEMEISWEIKFPSVFDYLQWCYRTLCSLRPSHHCSLFYHSSTNPWAWCGAEQWHSAA